MMMMTSSVAQATARVVMTAKRVVRAGGRHGGHGGVVVASSGGGRQQKINNTRRNTVTVTMPGVSGGSRGVSSTTARLAASAGGGDETFSASSPSAPPPRGFGSIAGDEGVNDERQEVPDSVQSDYRKVEDPEWLERELLRADDGYPTSRAAVMRQAASTGDVKGFAYAVSSINGVGALYELPHSLQGAWFQSTLGTGNVISWFQY
jgi:hypothetical protein